MKQIICRKQRSLTTRLYAPAFFLLTLQLFQIGALCPTGADCTLSGVGAEVFWSLNIPSNSLGESQQSYYQYTYSSSDQGQGILLGETEDVVANVMVNDTEEVPSFDIEGGGIPFDIKVGTTYESVAELSNLTEGLADSDMVTPSIENWTEKFLEEALLNLELDELPVDMTPLNGSHIILNSTVLEESDQDITTFNALPQRKYPLESAMDSLFRGLKFILRGFIHVFRIINQMVLDIVSAFQNPVNVKPQTSALHSFKNRKNFASRDSGATIMDKSNGINYPKAILSSNKEEYLILPRCSGDQEYMLIINLSEDVAIDTIVVSNHEDFSDILARIDFQGSIEYPPEREDQWVDLGSISPMPGQHEHVLSVALNKTRMIRYLRIVLRGQEGNELYCTLTSLKVFGQGMHVRLLDSLMGLMDQGGQLISTQVQNQSTRGVDAYVSLLTWQQQQQQHQQGIAYDEFSIKGSASDVCQSTDLVMLGMGTDLIKHTSQDEARLLKYLWGFQDHHQKHPDYNLSQSHPTCTLHLISKSQFQRLGVKLLDKFEYIKWRGKVKE